MQGRAVPVLPLGITMHALAARHLGGMLTVQRASYGDALLEGVEIFARRLASPAQCSLVLEQSGDVVAYLAAYRSQRGQVTPLHGDFEPVVAPCTADTLYLHDMAVLPPLAGCGLARALLSQLCAHAKAQGLRHTALVSVQGSQAYWERQGYAVVPLQVATQRARLSSYGTSAVYMARRLDCGAA